MLSGVLTTDSLTQAFRTLSQKRRHGMLEISSGIGQFHVLFHNGRIVGAQLAERPILSAVAERLANARLVPADLAAEVPTLAADIGELHQLLVGQGLVSEEQFLRAKHSYEMDVLYSLRKAQNGYFSFKARFVEADEQLGLSVAPGQVLLDMVELDADDARFQREFSALDAADVQIRPRVPEIEQASGDEAVVWNTLEVTSCLKEIAEIALLNEHQLRDALLALLERKAIEVERGAAQPRSDGNRKQSARSSILEHMLEDMQDSEPEGPKGFDVEELDLEGYDPSALAVALSSEPRDPETFEALINDAAELLEEHLAAEDGHVEYLQNGSQALDALRSPSAVPPQMDSREASPMAGDAQAHSERAGDSPDEDYAADVVEQEILRKRRIRRLLIASNFRLLEDRVLNGVTLGITLAFLLLLGVLGPPMVANWFEALVNFTSRG